MLRHSFYYINFTLLFLIGLFVIGVTNIGNTDPFFDGVGATATRSVDEDAAVGTDVGDTFSAKSLCFDPIRFRFPNHNDKFTYTVSSDNIQVNYSIQIETKVSLDYETTSSYTVRLILEEQDYYTDLWSEVDRVTVTINVNDVDEGTSVGGSNSTTPSTADALPTVSSDEREHILFLLTLDTLIFNELFNASNDAHDWIELRNVTDTDVDLSGWHLIVATSEMSETLEFPAETVLPAEALLLFLNTDPNAPDMPLATSEEASYHYLVDETFTLPQEDFMLLLRSPTAWEDSAGSYLFGQEKSPMTADFALDTAWFRAKPSMFGHEAEAWRVNGYQGGLGYDAGLRADLSFGTPGYPQRTLGDVNADGVVNILDLVLIASHIGESNVANADLNRDGIVDTQDLLLVAYEFGDVAAAPSVSGLTAAHVQAWLRLAKQVGSHPIQTSVSQHEFSYARGIQVLEQLRQSLIPKTTVLLANYPNPFNPETWIPYHLANPSDVQINIYDTRGSVVRQLDLGHQQEGYYMSKVRAAYWDGMNDLGESVASGVYFYTLTTRDFTATRKMLIRK